MSQSRRILREYAKSKGNEAIEFVEIEKRFGDYGVNTLITKNKQGFNERTSLDWEDLYHWINRNYKIEPKK